MKIKRIAVVILSIFVIAFGSLTLVFGTKDYSENENRQLSLFPKFTISSFFDGQYMKDIEKYTTDQFIGRDVFMNLYAYVQKYEGAKEINGVYLGADGYLIEKNTDYENIDKFVTKVNTLQSNTDANISIMLVPTSVTIYEDKLPKNAITQSQTVAIDKIYSKLSDKITKINITDELIKHKEEYELYYKTDHHWTTYGAYFGYRSYCEANNLKANEMSDYNIETITNKFYGTIFSKVNDTSITPDEIVAFKKQANLSVTYQNGVSNSLYNEDYLNKKDKYSYFLNNLNDMIVIVNNDIVADKQSEYSGKVLIVVKDSYANCFVPFLTDHYEKIIVLDTRSYMYGVSSLINNVGKADILILYNMGTLDTDEGINGIY